MFRQKDPKPLAPGRGPPGAFAPVPIVRAAELASLRQSSPPHRVFGTGAQPRPQAPGHGTCIFCHPRLPVLSSSTFLIEDPGFFLFPFVCKGTDFDLFGRENCFFSTGSSSLTTEAFIIASFSNLQYTSQRNDSLSAKDSGPVSPITH